MSSKFPPVLLLSLLLVLSSTEAGEVTDLIAIIRGTLRYWRKVYNMYEEEVTLGYCLADYFLHRNENVENSSSSESIPTASYTPEGFYGYAKRAKRSKMPGISSPNNDWLIGQRSPYEMNNFAETEETLKTLGIIGVREGNNWKKFDEESVNSNAFSSSGKVTNFPSSVKSQINGNRKGSRTVNFSKTKTSAMLDDLIGKSDTWSETMDSTVKSTNIKVIVSNSRAGFKVDNFVTVSKEQKHSRVKRSGELCVNSIEKDGISGTLRNIPTDNYRASNRDETCMDSHVNSETSGLKLKLIESDRNFNIEEEQARIECENCFERIKKYEDVVKNANNNDSRKYSLNMNDITSENYNKLYNDSSYATETILEDILKKLHGPIESVELVNLIKKAKVNTNLQTASKEVSKKSKRSSIKSSKVSTAPSKTTEAKLNSNSEKNNGVFNAKDNTLDVVSEDTLKDFFVPARKRLNEMSNLPKIGAGRYRSILKDFATSERNRNQVGEKPSSNAELEDFKGKVPSKEQGSRHDSKVNRDPLCERCVKYSTIRERRRKPNKGGLCSRTGERIEENDTEKSKNNDDAKARGILSRSQTNRFTSVTFPRTKLSKLKTFPTVSRKKVFTFTNSELKDKNRKTGHYHARNYRRNLRRKREANEPINSLPVHPPSGVFSSNGTSFGRISRFPLNTRSVSRSINGNEVKNIFLRRKIPKHLLYNFSIPLVHDKTVETLSENIKDHVNISSGIIHASSSYQSVKKMSNFLDENGKNDRDDEEHSFQGNVISEETKKKSDNLYPVGQPSLHPINQSRFIEDYGNSTSVTSRNSRVSRRSLFWSLDQARRSSKTQLVARELEPTFFHLRRTFMGFLRALGFFVQVGRELMDYVDSNTALACTKDYLVGKALQWIDS